MTFNTVHILHLAGLPIYEQLQVEEALFRSDARNWLILNSGSPPAVVMGISGRAENLLDCALISRDRIPVIRRFSGGGTVVVDESTLFVTFIFNKSCLPFTPFPDKIMKWSELLYCNVLNHPSFQLRENDYVIGDRKFGGNAQSIARERWVHHSSLLWDFDSGRMKYLLLPQRRPSYRRDRAHGDFLCKLKDFLPTQETLFEGIKRELQKSFQTQDVDMDEVLPLLNSDYRQSLSLVAL